jgi:PIN domain nuclease of toxin-antitoxin system
MRLLPDTHIWLWYLEGNPKLRDATRLLLLESGHEILLSTVVIWEIATKHDLGKSDFKINPYVARAELLSQGFRELAIEGRHAVAVSGLPRLHGDPFDRLLIGQAKSDGLTLVSYDEKIPKYGVPCVAQ